MAAKFVLKRRADGEYMFNLKAGNGEIILTSESYKAEAGAKNGIESVKKNAPSDERYERKTSKRDEPYFVLKAGNGETIGRSEMYSSAQSMENGIESVKKNGPIAEIKDETESA
jgi:uncharacterized protein YegP (UPF0339 family)